MSSSNYASFGLRWAAQVIDYLLLATVNWIIMSILGAVGFGIASMYDFDFEVLIEDDIMPSFIALLGVILIGSISFYLLRVLYGAFMESSKHQATIGKLAVGIKVTDADGGKLTFAKALLRHIGKIISGWVIFIGYLIALFTERKQALHDFIAGSIVVKK